MTDEITTLDAADPPLLEGHPDFSQDFFGRKTGLTVIEAYPARAWPQRERNNMP